MTKIGLLILYVGKINQNGYTVLLHILLMSSGDHFLMFLLYTVNVLKKILTQVNIFYVNLYGFFSTHTLSITVRNLSSYCVCVCLESITNTDWL